MGLGWSIFLPRHRAALFAGPAKSINTRIFSRWGVKSVLASFGLGKPRKITQGVSFGVLVSKGDVNGGHRKVYALNISFEFSIFLIGIIRVIPKELNKFSP